MYKLKYLRESELLTQKQVAEKIFCGQRAYSYYETGERDMSILFLIIPEALFSMCRNASYSPWISLKKYSVPFGRLRIAERFTISLTALSIVGNSLARSSKYFLSMLFSSNNIFNLSARKTGIC